MNKNDLKYKLSYVIKYGGGRISELNKVIGEKTEQQFESIGFIDNPYKNIWCKTKLADKYYKDIFGIFSFYKLKFF